jgi:transcriptional regulator of aromatic amino acid metabolism
MRSGAFDFVQKPVDLEQIELRVARAVEHRRLLAEVTELRAERAARRAAQEIVGDSPALRAAMDLALRVAPTRSTVLITGETGTGKELIASLIHRSSPRAEGPLVKVNCAALPRRCWSRSSSGTNAARVHWRRPTAHRPLRAGERQDALPDEVGDMSPATQASSCRCSGPGVPAPGGDPRAAH